MAGLQVCGRDQPRSRDQALLWPCIALLYWYSNSTEGTRRLSYCTSRSEQAAMPCTCHFRSFIESVQRWSYTRLFIYSLNGSVLYNFLRHFASVELVTLDVSVSCVGIIPLSTWVGSRLSLRASSTPGLLPATFCGSELFVLQLRLSPSPSLSWPFHILLSHSIGSFFSVRVLCWSHSCKHIQLHTQCSHICCWLLAGELLGRLAIGFPQFFLLFSILSTPDILLAIQYLPKAWNSITTLSCCWEYCCYGLDMTTLYMN